jgi:Zn-dependent M28 family amino/carboxypeptidase
LDSLAFFFTLGQFYAQNNAGQNVKKRADPLIAIRISTPEKIARVGAADLPVTVEGVDYTIATRYQKKGVLISKTMRFVGLHLEVHGLCVEYHVHDNETNPNVIGELRGKTNPERVFLSGAHIDGVANCSGVDDSASGSSAVLITADILSQYEWDCTFRFALMPSACIFPNGW